MTEQPTKTCTKCGRTFPATTEYFSKKKWGKYGIHSQCRNCERDYQRKYQKVEKRREWKLKYMKKYYQDPERGSERRKRAVKRSVEYRRLHPRRVNLMIKRKQIVAENGELLQTCTHCKRTLPATLEYFDKSTIRKDGITARCRDCRKQYLIEYYKRKK